MCCLAVAVTFMTLFVTTPWSYQRLKSWWSLNEKTLQARSSRPTRRLELLRAPLVTEKSTMLFNTTGVFLCCPGRHQARDQVRCGRFVRRQGNGVNTLRLKGKTRRYRGARQTVDRKKAIVTLAEGDAIDVMTGLQEKTSALKKFNPTTPGSAILCWWTARRCGKWAGQIPDRRHQQHRWAQQHGRVTARHRGGGHKRRYRKVDFRGVF